MNILVTGATGFLGKALCLALRTQGHQVVELNSKNCDLTQDVSLGLFNDRIYEQIYHLAAWTQAGDFCLYHPAEQWVINQQINTNVLAWWQKYQPQAKLITMGTSCSYAPELELKEENYLVGIPIAELFTYAMTKRMLYIGLLALQKQFGLKYLYLIPSTLYGPGYHTDGRQMHFIFDLIHKIARGKLFSEPVILWGDGYQRRELMFIDDFVKIALQLVSICNNDIINIGYGNEFTIRYFAELICEKLGYDFNAIQFNSSGYVGVQSKCLVIKKLKSLISELSLTPIEDGLAKTIDWFWKDREKLL